MPWGADGLIFGSADGDVWSQLDDVGTIELYGVAYGNGVWMAGGSGTIYRSTDNGDTWSSVYTSAGSIKDIAYDGTGGWSVFGGHNDIWGSTDGGDTWTQHFDRNDSSNLGSVAYSTATGLWMATGQSNQIIYSADGINWTWEDNGLFHTYGIAVDQNGTWVRVGEAGHIFYGTVGDWTNNPHGTVKFYGVAHDAVGLWTTVSDDGKIRTATTPEGTWTERADVGTASRGADVRNRPGATGYDGRRPRPW